MTTRLYIVLSLFLTLCLCTKRANDGGQSANLPMFDLSNIGRQLLLSPSIPEDSVAGNEMYVVIHPTALYDAPYQLVKVKESDYMQQRTVQQGTIVWRAPFPPIDDNEFVPVYFHVFRKRVRLFWIKHSLLQPLTDTTSIARIVTNSSMAQQILYGAIISRDTGLAAWALRKGASPICNYITGEDCFTLAAQSGVKEMYAMMKKYMDTTGTFTDRRLYLAFTIGDKDDFTEQVRQKIARRSRGRTPDGVKSELFARLLQLSQGAENPKQMLRGFRTAFKMMPQMALDTLSIVTLRRCILAAVKMNDTASISLLLSHYSPDALSSLFPETVEFCTTNPDAVAYMLALGEKQRIPDLTATYSKVLKNVADFPDSALCATLLQKGAAIPEAKNFNDDLLAVCCQGGRQRSAEYAVPEAEVLAVARMLAEHGADVNGRVAKDTTAVATSPLFIASHYGMSKVAAFLISKGANVNIAASVTEFEDESFPSTVIKSPLYLALEQNDTATANTLVKAGASYSLPGCDLLRAACKSNNTALFKTLIAQKLIVDATHLSFASFYGSDSIVRYLCKNHPSFIASFNDTAKNQSHSATPLTAALLGARYRTASEFWLDNGRYSRTISTLLDAGHRQNICYVVNNESLSPIDLAAMSYRFDLVGVLSNKGAPVSLPVVRHSLVFANTKLSLDNIQKFEKNLTGPFPFEQVYQLYQNVELGNGSSGSDSTVADTLKQVFLRHSSSLMPQLIAEIASFNETMAKKDSLSAEEFGRFLVDTWKQTQDHQSFWCPRIFNSSSNDERFTLPSFKSEEPFILNAEATSLTNVISYASFRYYNKRIIDICTKTLDLPVVTDALRSVIENNSFSNYATSSSSFSEIIGELLSSYEEILQDTARALSLYKSYFENIFTNKPSYEFFNEYGSQTIACFWTRRLLDGSASSLHALCEKLGELFPQESYNENSEYSEEETEDENNENEGDGGDEYTGNDDEGSSEDDGNSEREESGNTENQE